MSTAGALIRAAPAVPCTPWPRHVLTQEGWQALVEALQTDPTAVVVAMWADTTHVHALFRVEAEGTFLPASVPVADGVYPALSPVCPGAAWPERLIRDLWGHAAEGGRDARPWADHGHWANHAPLSLRPVPAGGPPEPPAFLDSAGMGRHLLPLGPVHGGITEPVHLRITADGEAVARLEARLGYLHKGTLALMRGKSPRAAARFAARLAGDSTVAHAIAFARAAEAASGVSAPPRAAALRAIMAEMERIAGHLADIAAITETIGFAPLLARCQLHREAILAAAAIAFGHRLMMDCVVPGGVAAEIAPGGPEAILRALAALAAELPSLLCLAENAPGLHTRLAGIGVTAPALVRQMAAGGVVGRAAGRDADLRRQPGYPPYQGLDPAVPVRQEGDADARLHLRLAELPGSIALLRDLLGAPAEGAIGTPLPPASGEGIGFAEGYRGDVWHWLRLDAGMIAACFPRDPAWLHWPLLEAAMAGGAVADLPLVAASLHASCAGMDL
jgi:Ni,Fe-hydrogenase III large subunit